MSGTSFRSILGAHISSVVWDGNVKERQDAAKIKKNFKESPNTQFNLEQ